jgi:hypothetical protein
MMADRPPLIALISATPAAIRPAEAAFARVFPAAVLWNILDDRLLIEATDRGGLDDELRIRMGRLIDHAIAGGAAGVLLTCSMYAPVARARDAGTVTVRAPDDAAFDRIASLAPPRLQVVASLPGALRDSCERLRAEPGRRLARTEVAGVLAAGAFAAASAGDQELLFDSIRAALGPGADADPAPVFLAQYSLAPAAPLLAERLGRTVITGPDCAAEQLRDQLMERDGAR